MLFWLLKHTYISIHYAMWFLKINTQADVSLYNVKNCFLVMRWFRIWPHFPCILLLKVFLQNSNLQLRSNHVLQVTSTITTSYIAGNFQTFLNDCRHFSCMQTHYWAEHVFQSLEQECVDESSATVSLKKHVSLHKCACSACIPQQ